jgi:hypothetical protein
MFLIIAMTVLAQNNKKPFSLELIQQPSALKIGQSNKFIFIVRNTSRIPITLSFICAAKAGLSWKTRGKTERIYEPSCDYTRIIHVQSLDPATKRIKYFTGEVPAGSSKDDFFTLQADESKSFEVELEVPKGIKVEFVNVRLSFESRYNGKAAGVEAWTGTPSYINLKMPIVN